MVISLTLNVVRLSHAIEVHKLGRHWMIKKSSLFFLFCVDCLVPFILCITTAYIHIYKNKNDAGNIQWICTMYYICCRLNEISVRKKSKLDQLIHGSVLIFIALQKHLSIDDCMCLKLSLLQHVQWHFFCLSTIHSSFWMGIYSFWKHLLFSLVSKECTSTLNWALLNLLSLSPNGMCFRVDIIVCRLWKWPSLSYQLLTESDHKCHNHVQGHVTPAALNPNATTFMANITALFDDASLLMLKS